MPRGGRPARRAVSRPVCADETNSALSEDRKLFGTSTIGPHPARLAPAVAPHDPHRSADACRSTIGRPTRPPAAAWASSSRGLLRDSRVLNARILRLPQPVVKDYACPYPALPIMSVLFQFPFSSSRSRCTLSLGVSSSTSILEIARFPSLSDSNILAARSETMIP
jgi:hypothetical protein